MSYIAVPKKHDVDVLAKNLVHIACLAKSWPPSWNGAKISIPVFAPNPLGYVGRILPGMGLYVDVDLKSVGITKPVPYVFQRTTVQKILQFVKEERWAIQAASLLLTASLFPKAIPGILFGAISSYQGLVDARLSGKGREFYFSKESAGGTPGNIMATWQLGPTGGDGALQAGAYPDVPFSEPFSKVNPGAWSSGLVNPIGTDKTYIISLGLQSTATFSYVLLVDLLFAGGNLDANTSVNQLATPSGALTRYTNGEGVMLTFDVQTVLGTTISSLLWNYTNQAGVTGRQNFDIIRQSVQPRILPVDNNGPVCQLQLGDFGVRSLETVRLSSPMGGGTFAFNLYFPLAMIPFNSVRQSAAEYYEYDFYSTIHGLVELTTTIGGFLGCLTAYCKILSASGESRYLLWAVNG